MSKKHGYHEKASSWIKFWRRAFKNCWYCEGIGEYEAIEGAIMSKHPCPHCQKDGYYFIE